MRIDRRSFIQRAALVAGTPALMSLVALASPGQSRTSSDRTPSVPSCNAGGTGENTLTLQIDGWDHLHPESQNGNEVWITINQSWRSAWR